MRPKHFHSWRVKGSVAEAGVRRFTLECACGKSKTKTQKTCKRTERPRKAIRKASKSMQAKLKEYAVLRAEFLTRNTRCAVFPHLTSDQIHHVRGRGKYLNDVSTWAAVSNQGHLWIHHNPKLAKERGLLELHI